MWYLDDNGDISQNENGIKLTDKQVDDVINAKANGKIVNYKNGELLFTEPEKEKEKKGISKLTTEQITNENQGTQALLMAEANQQICILQDAADLYDDNGIKLATDKEMEVLVEWKKYRVLLNRIDVSSSNVEWPKKPV